MQKPSLPGTVFRGVFVSVWAILYFSCSGVSPVVIFADPYGAEVFPQMEQAAHQAAQDLGVSVHWVNLPVQAEVPVFASSLPQGGNYLGILLPDLYEPEVKESLKSESRPTVLWGYGRPATSGSAVGWDRTPALKGLLEDVILEEELLRRPKPILFTAVFGPEGTFGQEETFLRSLWAQKLAPDRLWIYRIANTLDRGLALQAAGALQAQNADMVYVDAGRMSPEIVRSLGGEQTRLALLDWEIQKLEQKNLRFSLERDWKAFWKSALEAVLEPGEGTQGVPMTLIRHFSPENIRVKSFHIR